jgi:hypothetical protein
MANVLNTRLLSHHLSCSLFLRDKVQPLLTQHVLLQLLFCKFRIVALLVSSVLSEM